MPNPSPTPNATPLWKTKTFWFHAIATFLLFVIKAIFPNAQPMPVMQDGATPAPTPTPTPTTFDPATIWFLITTVGAWIVRLITHRPVKLF